MKERELFAAFRHSAGFSAQCVCGGWIDATTTDDVHEAVRIHNLSTYHLEWRGEQDAVDALKRVARRPCPCHDAESA